MEIKGIFDSHAHYDDEKFKDDRDKLLNELFKKGLYAICNVTADEKSLIKSKELSQKYDRIYTTAGIHPEFAKEFTNDTKQKIIDLAKYDKTVAIGEIGLDYHYTKDYKKEQIKVFEEQMEIAQKSGLPVVIHSREATEDTMSILKNFKYVKGVIHCFSSSKEIAKEAINMGYNIGFTGVVTFKNAKVSKEVLEYAPIDSILIETDCPYLAPEPFRGKRCDSSMLNMVVEQISNIKKIEYSEVIDKTRENAKKMYGIQNSN